MALNTWSGNSPATFLHKKGHSQIDFLFARKGSGDGVARRCAPKDVRVGGWRDMDHRALDASVRIVTHHMLASKPRRECSWDVRALNEAVRGDPSGGGLRERVGSLLPTEDSFSPDDLNQAMCVAATELFPRSSPLRATVPAEMTRLWELRKVARDCTLGPWTTVPAVAQAAVLRAWSKAAQFLAAAKKERDRSARAKTARMEGLLQDAKRAAERRDSSALFTIIRQLRPWALRPRVNFLESNGSPLTASEQHDSLAAYCRQLFSPPQTSPHL